MTESGRFDAYDSAKGAADQVDLGADTVLVDLRLASVWSGSSFLLLSRDTGAGLQDLVRTAQFSLGNRGFSSHAIQRT